MKFEFGLILLKKLTRKPEVLSNKQRKRTVNDLSKTW